MIIEPLIVVAIFLLSSGLIRLVLRRFFGKRLTVNLYLIMTPGPTLLVTTIYIWAMMGGLKNIFGTFVVVPIGVAIVTSYFIFIGKMSMLADQLKDLVDKFKI